MWHRLAPPAPLPLRLARLCRGLRLVARLREPLQVRQVVVVAADDVVALCADPVALWLVDCRLAPTAGSPLDSSPALGPITR